jgi:hypothetical protein
MKFLLQLGDNFSQWRYMYFSIQGILQFQLFQIPFVGTDTSTDMSVGWLLMISRKAGIHAVSMVIRTKSYVTAGCSSPHLLLSIGTITKGRPLAKSLTDGTAWLTLLVLRLQRVIRFCHTG